MVNEKNTKKDILAAYETALEENKKLRANKADSRNAIETKAARDEANSLATEQTSDYLDSITAAKRISNGGFDSLYSQMTGHMGTLTEISKAIKTKELELKEVHDIVREADSLAALIDANRLSKEKLGKQLHDMTVDFTDKENRLISEYDILERELKDANARASEEFSYRTELKAKRIDEALQDKIDEGDREFRTREMNLLEAEAELNKLKETAKEVPNLNAQLREVKQQLVQTVKDNAHEIEISKSELETFKASGSTIMATLTEERDQLKTEVVRLRSSLDSAQDRITDVAKQAIDGAQQRIVPIQPTYQNGANKTN